LGHKALSKSHLRSASQRGEGEDELDLICEGEAKNQMAFADIMEYSEDLKDTSDGGE